MLYAFLKFKILGNIVFIKSLKLCLNFVKAFLKFLLKFILLLKQILISKKSFFQISQKALKAFLLNPNCGLCLC